MAPRPLEITDLLWPVDAGGVPVPVVKADVLDRLRGLGQRRAARIVSALPAADGILDPGYVDALGFRVHCELQRLGEELQLARRVGALLGPVVERVRLGGAGPVRVVDVGCGLGFVVRAMAASSALGPDVELGAWVFHHARMREPVSRHDGVLSARRAYAASMLREAARIWAPGYDMRPVVGIRA